MTEVAARNGIKTAEVGLANATANTMVIAVVICIDDLASCDGHQDRLSLPTPLYDVRQISSVEPLTDKN